MVRLISHLKGSLCNQSVVFKFGLGTETQPDNAAHHEAVNVPTLRKLMESRSLSPVTAAAQDTAPRGALR